MNKSFKRAWTMLVASLATCATVGAEETNAPTPTRLDYQSFRIISERNIFNPNRSRGSDNRSYTRREPDRERRTRSSGFGLVGTMSYEKGRFAFFDGTSSDYRKVLQSDESIAGYKIAEIGPNFVILAGNGKEVHLEVGGRMRRQDGEWTVALGGESFENFTADTSESTGPEGEKTDTASASTTTAAPTGEVSDVLKRLMQKREQELQNEKK